MSKRYRVKKQQTVYLWDKLAENEKEDLFEQCSISDQLIREHYPNKTPDEVIDSMTEDEFKHHEDLVMQIYRKRKKAIKKALEENTTIEDKDVVEWEEVIESETPPTQEYQQE